MTKAELVLEFLKQELKNTEWEPKVFLAGGAVRDTILGRPIKDIDLVVNAPRQGGIRFATWLTKKVHAYKLGKNPVTYPRFGVAKLNLRGLLRYGDTFIKFSELNKAPNVIDLSDVDIECTMTRQEHYTKDSRKPKVRYGTLEQDVFRRDFTINSLVQNVVSGKILDLTEKGIFDIKRGAIRTPLWPLETFEEDPLRMIRAIRFATTYDFYLVSSLNTAIGLMTDRLAIISKERIQEELSKILMADKPSRGIKLLVFLGKDWKGHFPGMSEINAMRGVEQNKYHEHDVFVHTMRVLDATPKDLIIRLSALFHDVGKLSTRSEEDGNIHFYQHHKVGAKLTEKILRELKYSNDVIARVVRLVRNHMRCAFEMGDKALRKLRVEMGDDLGRLFDLMEADSSAHIKGQDIKAFRDRFAKLGDIPKKPTLPINGHAVMELCNIQPGPEVGRLLKIVEEAWYENPELTKADARNLIIDARSSVKQNKRRL